MLEPTDDEAREMIERYYGRHSKGALKRIAEKAGLSRQHLGRFRRGDYVAPRSIRDIKSAIVALLEENGEKPAQPARTVDTPLQYEPWEVKAFNDMAEDFESIAEKLRSRHPHHTPEWKIDRVLTFIEQAGMEAKRFAAELKRRTPRRQGQPR
jgi:hypothetical protein